MKATAIALALVLATAAAAAAASTSLSPTAPAKHDPGVVPPEGTLQGGDTIETAVVIPSVPHFATGTTAGFTDDYDEACPYTGSISPDVVYAWTASMTGYVEISTCESAYDTKIYVYETEWTPGAPLACNDDSQDCTGLPYRSWIHLMPVIAGSTYYIVVDGYGGDYGEYQLTIDWITGPEPCDVVCPSGAFDENEPDCYDGYVDETNSGCGWPYVFQYPGVNTYICGASGNHSDNTVRDMDWFEIVLDEPKTIEYCICADFLARIWIFTAPDDCYDYYMFDTEAAEPGLRACMEHELEAGTWYFIVSTDGWINVPCGSEYVASIFEEGYSPVDAVSWGVVKARYR
jgi:hypothetical protein